MNPSLFAVIVLLLTVPLAICVVLAFSSNQQKSLFGVVGAPVLGAALLIFTVAGSSSTVTTIVDKESDTLKTAASKTIEQVESAQRFHFKEHGGFTDNRLDFLKISPQLADNRDLKMITSSDGRSVEVTVTKEGVTEGILFKAGKRHVKVTGTVMITQGQITTDPAYTVQDQKIN